MLGYLRGGNMNFSERLKALREENNLTQSELAERLSISRQSVSNYEKGTRFPNDPKIILQISKLFDVSVDYLLGATSIRNFFKGCYRETDTKVKEEHSLYFSSKTKALEKLFVEVDDLSVDNINKITNCLKIFKEE